jgi:hypothetical protein
MRCSFKIHQRVNLLLIEVQGDWRIFKKKNYKSRQLHTIQVFCNCDKYNHIYRIILKV